MSAVSESSTPRYYRYQGGMSRLVPNTWERFHIWFFVIFLVATFGPMFHWFATSTKLVWGIPFTMVWILGWMVLQTFNLIGLYFTTIRHIASKIDREDESGLDTGRQDPQMGRRVENG